MTTGRVKLRDRFVAGVSNWLLTHVASKEYRAFVSSVYAAGRPALLWRLRSTRPEGSLGLHYTLMDARDMLVELEAQRAAGVTPEDSPGAQ